MPKSHPDGEDSLDNLVSTTVAKQRSRSISPDRDFSSNNGLVASDSASPSSFSGNTTSSSHGQQQQQQQQQQDPVIQEKLERLGRMEKQMAELIKQYKKLSQDFRAVERVIKDTTPLEDLNDVQALDTHLRNLGVQKQVSNEEMKRLIQMIEGT